MGHLRWADGIFSTGHFQDDNRYPIIHVLIAQIAHVCGLAPYIVVKILPVFFFILFVSCSYLLARIALLTQRQTLLASAGATTLFFGYYHVTIYPQALAVMVLPLVFYLYFRRDAKHPISFRLLFVILLLFLPFSHPAVATVIIVCLAGLEVAKAVWTLTGPTGASISRVLSRVAIEPTLISFIAFLTWISSFVFFGYSIRNILLWLRGEISSIPRVAEVQNLFAAQGIGIFQQVNLLLKMYGDNFIYLALSSIALFIIIRGFLLQRDEMRRLFVLSIPFVIGGPVWVLIFAVTLRVTLGRLLGSNVMMWATSVLGGLAIYRLFEKMKRTRVILVTFVLFCASAVAIFGVYHSPFVLQPSWQVTFADVYGANWFLAHYDSETSFATMGVPPAYASGGVDIPEHFDYHESSTFGPSFGRPIYLLLTERFRKAGSHPVLSKAMLSDARLARTGFTDEDFAQLERDPTVSKFYTNGEFDIYLTRSIR
jgi:hypothetical protein